MDQADDYLYEIAIIGMAGRFPGAKDIATFWQNIRDGIESISFFSIEELAAAGIDSTLLQNPNYIRAAGSLDDVDLFDAAFFGLNPREAELMDPQQRVFLEGAWQALEAAGYNPTTYEGRIGIYAGASTSTYLLTNLLPNRDLIEKVGAYQTVLSNDKDFLATRVAYKLDLKGPAVTVQTACSTSLVAVHFACQSLLNHECHIALAGGVSISSPPKAGYLYQPGGIAAPDGHCRAFDAQAKGTVGGNGMGIVVLKRLADALTDGDMIHAVIKGSAINNDGADKVGYTAPGVTGQSQVIVESLTMADAHPETIGYVEAHGTGTELGDPVEVTALTEAFRLNTDKKGFCALGSVKTNIGHLDAAAGIAGLIKAALALQNKQIPPSLHFTSPNPQIDLANSPFYVNTELKAWPSGMRPRRAGVSSFGIGGTNAHVILEEAPAPIPSTPDEGWQLLPLAAKTTTALSAQLEQLTHDFQQQPDLRLADVAYTLQVGRQAFTQRAFVVSHDLTTAQQALQTPDSPYFFANEGKVNESQTVTFMFPGQGTQYVGMGRELYGQFPYFREQVDECAARLKPLLGLDLRTILFPDMNNVAEQAKAAQLLNQTEITQPALFVISYALARLWQAWGIQPQAMIGHSIGEYVAACLAGVFSLADALQLVTVRGRVMGQMLPGGMLAILLSEQAVLPWLTGRDVSLAAVNGAEQCVVAGPVPEITALEQALDKQNIIYHRLQTSHAFHSAMMDAALNPFINEMKTVALHPPQIPYLSNVTGSWITDSEATDPAYWARQIRQTVRFTDGIRVLVDNSTSILLEVGPGQSLMRSAQSIISPAATPRLLPSLPHHRHTKTFSESACLLTSLGQLWVSGLPVNWAKLHLNQPRRRIMLPTYPFERVRYWIEINNRLSPSKVPSPLSDEPQANAIEFYLPAWRRTLVPTRSLETSQQSWLILSDVHGLGSSLVEQLRQADQPVIVVKAGHQFVQIDAANYTIRPGDQSDYETLWQHLAFIPQVIVHLWSLTENETVLQAARFLQECQERGYYSLLNLVQALEQEKPNQPIQIVVVANHLYRISGTETIAPEKAPLLGLSKVIFQEYSHLSCRCVDVTWPVPGQETASGKQLLRELMSAQGEPDVAYRGYQRWVQTFEPVSPDMIAGSPRLRQGGTYLITGGLGRIGLLLADYLIQSWQAKVVLLGRSGLLHQGKGVGRIESSSPDTTKARLRTWEEQGAQVLVIGADVADEQQMQTALEQIHDHFGTLHGVFHAAALTTTPLSDTTIHQLSRELSEQQFRAKLYGLQVLEKVLPVAQLDFCVLFSSTATILGGLGMAAYAAANAFMDAFAESRHNQTHPTWITINWDGWHIDELKQPAVTRTGPQFTLQSEPALLALEQLLTPSIPARIVVAAGHLAERLDLWVHHRSAVHSAAAPPSQAPHHPRPALTTPYLAPRNEMERQITYTWQTLLGIEPIGVDDNFFELGGHSLLGTQLLSQLRQLFQVNIPLHVLFEKATVADLALTVADSLATQIDQQLLGQLEHLSLSEIEQMLGDAPSYEG